MKRLALLICLALPASAVAATPDERAAEVVAQMTLAEKVDLVTGTSICDRGADGRALGPARLGIPDVMMVGAGQGVANVCAAGRGNATGNTLLPAPLAMAASWDESVARASGVVIGRETRQAGMNTSIGGDVNLARDPRHGRTYEGEGEDPLLAGTIVGAQLRGTRSQHVVTTIKHFAMNNIEANRGTQSSNADEDTMRETELRAFEIGIERSGAGAVMCAYNKVNGTNACESEHLLTGVLKRDWGFKGWVMSDWWACSSAAAGDPVYGFCDTTKAANAGLDQEMPNARFFGPALLAAVTAGSVPQERLDDMVHRILRTMFADGVIDDPPVAGPIDAEAGAAAAQSIAEQSAVLLRNEDRVLPLNPTKTQRIAVIGSPADEAPAAGQGSAAVTAARTDTALGAITEQAPAATITFDDGADPARAAGVAKAADVAIVVARDSTSEGVDRTSLSLPQASHRCYLPGCYWLDDVDQDDLIAAVAEANPKTVVVLMTGGPVTMPWVGDVAAVLEAWYPGEYGGHAIARLLFGRVNPSGRLPLTFPKADADLPTAGSPDMWPGDSANIEYRERTNIGYRHYEADRIAPLFPFGFGLSYGARFAYSALRVDGDTVRFRVRNAGTRTATETPQVYAGAPKWLRAFTKVRLRAGETKDVALTMDGRPAAVGCGDDVMVGASATDIRLRRRAC